MNILSFPNGSFGDGVVEYTDLGHISLGESATVNLVDCFNKSTNTKKLAAIKTIKDKYTDCYKQELLIFKKLMYEIDHPFIIKAHAYSSELSNTNVILMEYIDNLSLWHITNQNNRKSLTIYAYAFMMAEISEGLDMIHKIGVIHQDLKSDNILIRGNGHLVICDFDISIIVDKPMEAYRKSHWYNSQHFAPEMRDPRIKILNHAVDYYSLGVIVYMMITGSFPPDPLLPSYRYLKDIAFTNIPLKIKDAVKGLLNPIKHTRLCNNKFGNRDLLLEPGIKSILDSKLGPCCFMDERKEKIRKCKLPSPFKMKDNIFN